MKFAFELAQRVACPGSNGRIQGIITETTARIGAENHYVVTAVTDEGKTGTIGYGEAALLAAQSLSNIVKVKRVSRTSH